MKNKLKKSLLLMFIIFILSIVSSTKAEASTVNIITFDSRFYAEQNADLMGAFGYNDGALYNHYVNCGIDEGRMASMYFDVNFYKSTYADLRQAFGNNARAYYDHFVNCGITEGRQGSMYLDINYYKNTYGDLRQAFGNNNRAYYEHFVNAGINEGRAGSANFDVKAYLANYGDLQKAFGTNYREAMKHYIRFGKNEGRQASSSVNNGGNGNTSNKLSEIKKFGNYEVSNIKITQNGGTSTVLASVKNITNQKLDMTFINIICLDKNNNKINTISGIIGELNTGETTQLRASSTTDLSKTYDIKFEYETEKQYINGYEVMGNIEIPKTNINLPVLEKVTKKSLETSVAILYGTGLNQAGNTTIVGHNYRNGTFFSDNKNLSKGDIIYITDQTGVKITYQIYDIFETDPSDAEYMKRDTKGAREISLSACTDDSSERLIILAKEV